MARRIPLGVLPRQIEQKYKTYAFDEYLEGASLFYQDGSEWVQKTNKLTAILEDAIRGLSTIDMSLAVMEAEFLRSLNSFWRHKGLGSLIAKEAEVKCDNDEQNVLLPYLDKLRLNYLHHLSQMSDAEIAHIMSNAPVNMNKSKGSPHWIGGGDEEIPYHYMRLYQHCRTYEDLQQALISLSGRNLPICCTSLIRVQSTKKKRHPYVMTSTGLQLDTSREVYVPKNRRVLMQSYPENCICTPIAKLIRWIQAHRSLLHTGNPKDSVFLGKQFRYRLAADKSSYDTHMAYQAIKGWIDRVVKPILEYLWSRKLVNRRYVEFVLDICYAKLTMPVLCPPNDESYGADLIDSFGTNKSGDRFTSAMATDINWCVTRAKAERYEIPCVILTFGDDTLVLSDSTRIMLWAKDLNFLGYPETIAPDPSFLMRRIHPNAPNGHTYLLRMILSTLNREPMNEPRTITELALGYKMRMEYLDGHPLKDWYPICYDVIAGDKSKQVKAMAQCDLQTLGDTLSILMNKANLKQRSQALSKLGWLVREARGEAVGENGEGEGGEFEDEDELFDVTDLAHKVPFRTVMDRAKAIPLEKALNYIRDKR